MDRVSSADGNFDVLPRPEPPPAYLHPPRAGDRQVGHLNISGENIFHYPVNIFSISNLDAFVDKDL